MKHRHTLLILLVTLPVCVLLRTIQMFFTIDSTTGFIKQQYSAISVIITVIICAATASVGLLATTIESVKPNFEKQRPAVAIASVLVGGMFIYRTVADISTLSGAWYDILLVFLALVSAFVFVAYGLRNIYEYNMPSLMLTVPVIYYVVKLISIFVSTSALALVTENIFLIFTGSVLLWFMFEFASYENEMGDMSKKAKSLFASGLAAIMLCAVTSIPKFILAASSKTQLSSGDISSALLNAAMGIFVLVYIVCNFTEKSENTKSVGKHSA